MATDVPINPTATDHYRRDGYTILRNVFNPKEIASLRDECRVKGQIAYIGPRDFNGLLLSQKIIEPLRQDHVLYCSATRAVEVTIEWPTGLHAISTWMHGAMISIIPDLIRS